MTDDNVMTPGSVVGNRYEIRDMIARGGFSITYRAVDKQLLDHPCVVKELLLLHHSNELAVTLFKREAQVLLKLDHKGVPKVHACFEEHDRFFLVQDFVQGETLEHKLTRESRLSEVHVREILLQLVDVLEYLHGHEPQVIHRDIKPANIIERPDGRVVLIDFGAVREALGGADTIGQTAISSAGYSPHEQYLGRASAASDIYALGATALHLISGTHPRDWHDPTTSRLTFHGKLPCSGPFAAAIEGMVSDLPQRFRSAASVRAALQGKSTTLASASPDPTTVAPVFDQTKLASSAPLVVVPEAPRRGLIERWWPAAAGVAVLGLVLVAVLKPDAKSDATPSEMATATPVTTADSLRQQGQAATATSTPPRGGRPPSNASPTSSQPSGRTQNAAAQPSERIAATGKADALTSRTAAPAKADSVTSMAAAPVKADSVASMAAAARVGTNAPTAAPTTPVVVPDACAGRPRCFNAGHFTATLAYVAVSQVPFSGSIERNVKLTVKLQNLTDKPIILAYRSRSGQLVDDQQNRYRNEAFGREDSFVKGIGISTANDANPEFSLDPQEARDVILDNTIHLSTRVIFGITYSYDFTIDELVMQGTRARSSRSVAISFRDITERSRGGGAGDDTIERDIETMSPDEEETQSLGVSERVTPRASQDPCGAPNCYNAGRFIATVTRLWRRQVKFSGPTNYFTKLTIRIRNVSDKQIALAYKAASAQLIDESGHRYLTTRRVHGIAFSDNPTDPPLVLVPGEARDVTFDHEILLNRADVPGIINSYDLVLQELELLPSGQTRVTRTNAVAFHDLKESVRSSATEPNTAAYDAGRFVAGINQVSASDRAYTGATEHLVTMTMSIKNVTDQPMILAYRANSQQLSDDRGHTFQNDQNGRDVTGIGLNRGNNVVDGVFTLAPGESREASFKNLISIRNDDRPGSRYDYDLVLDECERLPSNQLRVVRTYAVSFHDFQDTPRSKRRMLFDALKPVIKKSPN